jgi:hypothetical protein
MVCRTSLVFRTAASVRSRLELRQCILFKELNGIADGQDGFRGIVGNLETELSFEFECQFDDIETISPEIIDEARAIDHLIRIDK